VSARSTTLKREDLQAGVEADDAFYIGHAQQMKQRKRHVNLASDPPPDLIIEVEVTSRLKERVDIYREMGVPELWRFRESGLEFLLNRGDRWESVPRSPTFPQIAPQEIFEFVSAGLDQEETSWSKSFRVRVREAIASR